jgi:hypothetical protein
LVQAFEAEGSLSLVVKFLNDLACRVNSTDALTCGFRLGELASAAVLRSLRRFRAADGDRLLVGLTAGAIVLRSTNGSGGSMLAVAVWHALYNLCAATTEASRARGMSECALDPEMNGHRGASDAQIDRDSR